MKTMKCEGCLRDVVPAFELKHRTELVMVAGGSLGNPTVGELVATCTQCGQVDRRYKPSDFSVDPVVETTATKWEVRKALTEFDREQAMREIAILATDAKRSLKERAERSNTSFFQAQKTIQQYRIIQSVNPYIAAEFLLNHPEILGPTV